MLQKKVILTHGDPAASEAKADWSLSDVNCLV